MRGFGKWEQIESCGQEAEKEQLLFQATALRSSCLLLVFLHNPKFLSSFPDGNGIENPYIYAWVIKINPFQLKTKASKRAWSFLLPIFHIYC